MHYDAYAFAIDRNIPTITAKDGSTLGNTVGFSTVIIIKIITILIVCIKQMDRITFSSFYFIDM